MSYTYEELKELLLKEDELTLLEILDLSTEELVEELDEVIYKKQERVRQFYGEDSEELDWEEN